MKKNKICCALNFAPHYREEIFLLMEREFDCDFYFGSKSFADIKKVPYSKFNKKVHELPFLKLYKNFYFLKNQISLSFSNYNQYIITGQPYNISAWFLLIFNKIQGKKTFIWNHGWYGNENQIKKILKKMQLHLATGYLLYGNYAKTLMEIEGLDNCKLHVVYNSLDYTKGLEIRKNLKKTNIYKKKFSNNYPILVFIGRLTKAKKLDILINAMDKLSKKNKQFNLVFIGDGAEKMYLLNLVDKYNLKRQVWFYGACYQEEKIGELIFNADLCVSPGNIGLTAIHALMFGTPAITHNNFVNQMPEFEAIKNYRTGAFFAENDIDSLFGVIDTWINKFPSKSDLIIQNCFNIIDTYYNPEFQIKVLKRVLQ